MFQPTEQDKIDIMIPPPQQYKVPHTTWREGQYEAVQWILENQGNMMILQAPTGSGKTGLSKAVSSQEQTTAICRTKSLQVENYQNTYDFDVLFGKANYQCKHHNFSGKTCEAGLSDPEKSCDLDHVCPYRVAKRIVMNSNKASLNYAYWLSAQWTRLRPPKVLFLDEAHQLSDITLDWAGCEVAESTRKHWGLSQFPELKTSGGQSVSLFMTTKKPEDEAKDWISKSITVISEEVTNLYRQRKDGDDKIEREIRRGENFIRKLQSTLNALQANPYSWFIQSGSTASRDVEGRLVPKFICKPLSAKYHFKNYFSAETVVAMSATIGNPEGFAEELGLDQYLYHSIPNQWPPETRPVYDLGAPSMGRKATYKDFEKQADVIANAIKECPSSWHGIIHVTRKTEATYLARRLAKRGLSDRVWVPEYDWPTHIAMKKWDQIKKSSCTGRIMLNWTFWEGVDLKEERICLAAKTPYPFLGDPYEVARMKYSGKIYQWRTATMLEQGLGRSRRGEIEDYDLNGRREQLVGIADGSWSRVKNSFSQDLREAITEW